MLLSHQAGICGSETNNVDDYYEQSIMARELANMTPIWEPGTALDIILLLMAGWCQS